MNFLLSRDDAAPCLIDAVTDETLNYSEVTARVQQRADELSAYTGALVFLGASLDVQFVVDYLALISAGATVALLSPSTTEDILGEWVNAYRPDACWGMANIQDWTYEGPARPAMRERLLLATSGSTGSPKFVRLTAHNLVSNAQQIVQALNIGDDQRVMACLPPYYSYGLSILNSHLLAGSSIVLCSHSIIRPEFWTAMRRWSVTTLPGVPFSYDLYFRMGLLTMDLPDLRHVTQAGGRLAPDRVRELCAALAPRDVEVWVMYGQTEATARMSVLPSRQLPQRAGSVGIPVPGAAIRIVDQTGEEVPAGAPTHGEIIFRGDNVMLGYAERREDLDGVDRLGGVLNTGDLGYLDADGYLWIVGRSRRIAKVYGTRVNLEDVEDKLSGWGPVAAVEDGDGISVFIESGDAVGRTSRQAERLLAFSPQSIRLRVIDKLPRLPTGKIDYGGLERIAQGGTR